MLVWFYFDTRLPNLEKYEYTYIIGSSGHYYWIFCQATDIWYGCKVPVKDNFFYREDCEELTRHRYYLSF